MTKEDTYEATMLAVVEKLKVRGVDASYEWPGYIAVHVPVVDLMLNFGNASELFGCSITDMVGQATGEYIESCIRSDSTDVDELTDFICCHYTQACEIAPEYGIPEDN